MVETLQPHRIISFANFEVDLQAGELRKAGMRLKLTGQPFQVLAILLEHPGEVVTREELQKRLWPDTFVDVDHNLNTAINKIREVLGDSAENPRFVETLARRGYRFIGRVNQPDLPPVEVTNKIEEEKKSEVPGKTSAWKLWPFVLVVLAAALAILAIAATFIWLRPPQTPPRVLATTQLTKDGVPKYKVLTDGSRLYIGESGGTYLYFETYTTDKPGYYRVQFGQTQAELVVDLKDFQQFSTNNLGVWSGITPDGSPLFVRDTGTDEIYALDLELP